MDQNPSDPNNCLSPKVYTQSPSANAFRPLYNNGNIQPHTLLGMKLNGP